jgi:hypothetical protein
MQGKKFKIDIELNAVQIIFLLHEVHMNDIQLGFRKEKLFSKNLLRLSQEIS